VRNSGDPRRCSTRDDGTEAGSSPPGTVVSGFVLIEDYLTSARESGKVATEPVSSTDVRYERRQKTCHEQPFADREQVDCPLSRTRRGKRDEAGLRSRAGVPSAAPGAVKWTMPIGEPRDVSGLPRRVQTDVPGWDLLLAGPPGQRGLRPSRSRAGQASLRTMRTAGRA
jgi:hypothetical protein